MGPTNISSRSARLIAFLVVLALPLVGAPAPPARSEAMVPVIIQGRGDLAATRAVVEKAGGRVTYRLPIIDGIAADLPAGSIEPVEAHPTVAAVTFDTPIEMQHYGHEQRCAGKKRKALKRCKKRVHRQAAAAQRIQRVVRADNVWAEGNRGQRATVAVLDTGVYSSHPDLRGRVVHCEDFSGEFETPPPSSAPSAGDCNDPFGHGTFMAGLIAGDGASSKGKYSGVAPRSKIVSIKVAGYDGSTDISKILAGIQWAVSFGGPDQYDIGVLNLSLGSDSDQSRDLSPLNYAVQEAWAEGIVVVVSAGNDGDAPRTLMKPGDDPYVITVGSSNDEGTVTVADDRIPAFSSRGATRSEPALQKPDVVSPGVHTVSLRSPGSAIDTKYGGDARVEQDYFRGSGTSMSTATVSGIAALMLTDDPSLTPDQVKSRLLASAMPITDDELAAGAGVVDAFGAVHCDSCTDKVQDYPRGSGLGSLDGDRETVDVFIQSPETAIEEVPSTGEFAAVIDDPVLPPLGNPAGLLPWLSATYAGIGWDPTTWDASSWKTDDWAASSWKASSWKATEWDASSWKGTEWANPQWEASSWKGVDWDTTEWEASSWKSSWYAVAWD
ncbi:MAG: S8 family peptidase [Actinomycetota bacterium]